MVKFLLLRIHAGTTLLNRADRIYNGVETTTSGDGAGATFRITRDSSGVVDSVTIVDGGYGYANGDFVTIPGGFYWWCRYC